MALPLLAPKDEPPIHARRSYLLRVRALWDASELRSRRLENDRFLLLRASFEWASRTGDHERKNAMNEYSLSQRLTAEFLGTLWLVLGGCGSAVLAAAFPAVGIGLLGVALAFGLSVLTMAYAVGHVSGGHFNPAVTVGLCTARRFRAPDVVPYIIAQLAGAICAAAILYFIASGKAGFDLSSGFAANGYDRYSPGGYSLVAALVAELVMSFFFLTVILGSTNKRAPQGMAGIAIGLALTLIHLVTIPVTNTSVNPARSTSQALFVGGWAIRQLWLFWVAPIVGGALAGIAYRFLGEERKSVEPALAQPVTS